MSKNTEIHPHNSALTNANTDAKDCKQISAEGRRAQQADRRKNSGQKLKPSNTADLTEQSEEGAKVDKLEQAYNQPEMTRTCEG